MSESWSFYEPASPLAVDDHCWVKDDSWFLDEYQLCRNEMYRNILRIRKSTSKPVDARLSQKEFDKNRLPIIRPNRLKLPSSRS